jgi:enediyne biosynthesis protein E4
VQHPRVNPVLTLLICVGAFGPVTFRAYSELHWETGAGFRRVPLSLPANGKPGFTLMGPSTGILFTNHLPQSRWLTNTMLLNGSGIAAGDIDNDGLCDLYFCRLTGPNALFHNLNNWQFEEIAVATGVACSDITSTGCAFADLDGDHDLDLIVNSFLAGTHIFFNDGRGHFTPSPAPVLNPGRLGESLALADIDGDGDLDLYVTNYRVWTIRDRPETRLTVDNVGGKPTVTAVDGRPASDPDLIGRFTVTPAGKFDENGEADAFFLNDGKGQFSPVPWTEGAFLDEDGRPLTTPPFDWGLSVMLRDMTGDGLPDIYVCNDFDSPDRFWINRGNGRFQAAPRLSIRSSSIFSMGVDFADINRDGYDDFFTADMLSPHHSKRHVQIGGMRPVRPGIGQIDNRPQYSRNCLFLGSADGMFSEIGCFSGVIATEWSWNTTFLDVDLDGFEDLLVTTGHEIDAMNADVTGQAEAIKAQRRLSALEQLNLRKMYDRLTLPKVAFRNRGDLTFEDASAKWGLDTRAVAHGLALADLDNDGDLDLAVNCLNGPAEIFRNNAVAPRIAVRLKGNPPNTRGIGAKIKVLGGPVPQSQEIIAGGRYLAGDEPMRVFAAGSPTNRLTIAVTWRSGKTSVVNAEPNSVYEIDEASSQTGVNRELSDADAPSEPWFSDVSHLIDHKHQEDPFEDFDRQPLLGRRLSQLGPGVAWHDLDADGWDDLIIASGRGGRLGAFRNTGNGGFTPRPDAPFNKTARRDQTTVLGIADTLLVGLANYEDGTTNGGTIAVVDWQRKASGESILGPAASTGPMALQDVDGDGDLDLFIGGRVVAGRYPEAPTSLLLANDGGRFATLQRWSGESSLGLISGAVFADLDDDGRAELVLACEWGPVRVLRNDGHTFREVTREYGLADFTGWWNGVTAGDFDNDGRLDIVASNWGLNHRSPATREFPVRLFYGDFGGDGTIELIETRRDADTGQEVPERGRNVMAASLPLVLEKFPTFTAYGKASVRDLLGDNLPRARHLEVTELRTMVFLNRGGRFEPRALPREAQLSPAFGISVGDMDGDGNEDIFLSQNFFAVNPDAWRHDAGRGLWLRGDGKGGFAAVSPAESGVKVYGEQRGCALGDYDGDGRVDLVVTQNGAATKLFRNARAKPGLRVRLRGEGKNTSGIGATMRLVYADRQGPVREIHAGSGYWSQDSAIQVLNPKETARQIRARWPGGKVTDADLPTGAREVEIASDGRLKVLR